MATIGIDLGTAQSCVGVWSEQNNRAEIVTNQLGHRVSPSCVAYRFHEDDSSGLEVLVCEAASQQRHRNPKNTVDFCKILLGRTFDDEHVQFVQRHGGVAIVEKDGKPMVQLRSTCGPQEVMVSPEEVLSHVLKSLKTCAEHYIHADVASVVFNVPLHFDAAQRDMLTEAASQAGMEVKAMIPDAAAAAVAYGLDTSEADFSRVLVFDVGYSTCAVTLLAIRKGVIEVLSHEHSDAIGGSSFDDVLYDHLSKEFRRSSRGLEVGSSAKAKAKLGAAVERAKSVLSTAQVAHIGVDSLCEGVDLHTKVTRARFEMLSHSIFNAMTAEVRRVLASCGVTHEDIDEVVLMGGSTDIPKVAATIRGMFPGKTVHTELPSTEVAALGTAIEAAVLSGIVGDLPQSRELDVHSTLQEVVLCTGNEDERAVVFPKGTLLPALVKRTLQCTAQQSLSMLEAGEKIATLEIEEEGEVLVECILDTSGKASIIRCVL